MYYYGNTPACEGADCSEYTYAPYVSLVLVGVSEAVLLFVIISSANGGCGTQELNTVEAGYELVEA